MLERDPTLVWRTITGDRTVFGLIGVYLVIFGLLEPDEPLLLRERDFEPDREPPERELPERPPPRPLASARRFIAPAFAWTYFRSTVDGL